MENDQNKKEEDRSKEYIENMINRTLLEEAIDRSKNYFFEGTKRVGRLISRAGNYANRTGEYVLGNERMEKIRNVEYRRERFYGLVNGAVLLVAIGGPLIFMGNLSKEIEEREEERQKIIEQLKPKTYSNYINIQTNR